MAGQALKLIESKREAKRKKVNNIASCCMTQQFYDKHDFKVAFNAQLCKLVLSDTRLHQPKSGPLDNYTHNNMFYDLQSYISFLCYIVYCIRLLKKLRCNSMLNYVRLPPFLRCVCCGHSMAGCTALMVYSIHHYSVFHSSVVVTTMHIMLLYGRVSFRGAFAPL